MTWKTTSFERQKFFDEVWTTPVTMLANAYGLSDPGLRKLCVALDVPLPPRGYLPRPAEHYDVARFPARARKPCGAFHHPAWRALF